MNKYLVSLIEYSPIILGTGATLAVALTGVGPEISDMLNVESPMGQSGIDTVVMVGTMFGVGAPTELVKDACMRGYYRRLEENEQT